MPMGDISKVEGYAGIFNSQLNTSGREPRTCDKPVSHSTDKPTEELKSIAIIGYPLPKTHFKVLFKPEIVSDADFWLPPTIPTPTCKHIDKATNIIYTHTNRHTDNEISEKESALNKHFR